MADSGAKVAAVPIGIRVEMSLQFWFQVRLHWTHPGNVEASYAVCIASASNLTGLVNASVECRRSGL